MERDHGRGLKQQPAWTPGHNFSLAGSCFSWSPSQRSPSTSAYTCGYCRREFRSAQALGGHMNVHRRDRARLRQCCSAYAAAAASLQGHTPSQLIAAHHHRTAPSPLPNLNLLPPTTAEPVVYSFFSTAAAAAMKAAAVEVNLDLGIGGGACSRGGGVADQEGGLDLELRLGCSWE
ncbi:hypothetical protein EJB05_47172, partial [Eragrostis curvula]